MLINIQDDIIRLHADGLLSGLLADRTTGKNIMWATDAYAPHGKAYERNEEIKAEIIAGNNLGVIKARARKNFEQQSVRTRQRAEVFTPLWVCKKMVDHADDVWFGRENVFDEARVDFRKRSWKQYVDSRRLEITCGEAPYLVSRYDVSTGEVIPLRERIGILDRKLRVVGENAKDEDEWLEWALRAVQATYGYEFQGDNLLIARVNVLMTWVEHLEERWQRKPTRREYETLLKVVTWNIWQMDGLTYTIPYRKAEEEFQQFDFFVDMGFSEEKEEEKPYCRIYDWRANKSIEFAQMAKRK